ncbi:MAG: hypothetical protein MHM6MM_006067 [Cercozoa sp. M6MM]
MSSDLEVTLIAFPKVYAFRVPPKSTRGYMAGEWDKDAVWTGRLRVADSGEKLLVKLEQPDNSLWAMCPVDKDDQWKCVEPVKDSRRYFVLRLLSGDGRVAHIGIGFDSAEDSFEFKAALTRHRDAATAAAQLNALAQGDCSLADGEQLQLGAFGAKKKHSSAKESDAKLSENFCFAPPPTANQQRRRRRRQNNGNSSSQSTSSSGASPASTPSGWDAF